MHARSCFLKQRVFREAEIQGGRTDAGQCTHPPCACAIIPMSVSPCTPHFFLLCLKENHDGFQAYHALAHVGDLELLNAFLKVSFFAKEVNEQ